jgi:UDP-glucose 4-epimerase
MDDKPITIFGKGEQIRDYIYIDDLADAFLAACVNPKCNGEIYNVGSGSGTTFKDMVETIIQVIGKGKIEHIPWPDDYINVETGDYVADIKKISEAANWKPKTDLKTGIKLVYQYYSRYRSFYW